MVFGYDSWKLLWKQWYLVMVYESGGIWWFVDLWFVAIDLWSMVNGLWFVSMGLWFEAIDLWSMVGGLWFVIWGHRFVVYGWWFVVGLWLVTMDLWFMVGDSRICGWDCDLWICGLRWWFEIMNGDSWLWMMTCGHGLWYEVMVCESSVGTRVCLWSAEEALIWGIVGKDKAFINKRFKLDN